tara:strand:- start:2229 stop:3089 length:861 start_codon:yes stop_codon:yes gene_type:complete
MIKSMTGFGRGSAGQDNNKVEIEIRTVNSRFLEVRTRGLTIDPNTEEKVRAQISSSLKRGNVQVRIEAVGSQDTSVLQFNRERYEIIQNILNDIHVEYGQRLGLSDLITTNDLLISSEPDSVKPDFVFKAVEKSLKQLNEMRLREGELIRDDILSRIQLLQKTIDTIADCMADYSEERQSVLRDKISNILEGEVLDESRLLQEIIYLTDRADITEEIVRCRIHFSQLKDYLSEVDPVGKRINFLIQEIGREVNTIGAKSPKTEITQNVVEIKDQLEKIREQAQNIL